MNKRGLNLINSLDNLVASRNIYIDNGTVYLPTFLAIESNKSLSCPSKLELCCNVIKLPKYLSVDYLLVSKNIEFINSNYSQSLTSKS